MSVTRDDIINEIKKVYDPEIPVNIWDLGLIYDISMFAIAVALDDGESADRIQKLIGDLD